VKRYEPFEPHAHGETDNVSSFSHFSGGYVGHQKHTPAVGPLGEKHPEQGGPVGGHAVGDISTAKVAKPAKVGDFSETVAAGADPPYWPIEIRWGTARGDIAVRDPWTGDWHEFAYRAAPEAWKLARRLSL